MSKNVEAAEPVVFNDVEMNVAYETRHNGRHTVVYPHRIRGDVLLVKRSPEAVDSTTISRARFDRYYKRVV